MLRRDQIATAVANMRRQPLRFLLSLGGITLATAMLTISLTVSLGVRSAITEHLSRQDLLRRMEVLPGRDADQKVIADAEIQEVPEPVRNIVGTMSEARRDRLRRAEVIRWRSRVARIPRVPLTRKQITELQAMPEIERIRPIALETVQIRRGNSTLEASALPIAADSPTLASLLVAGQWFADDQTPGIVLDEATLYRLGVRDEAEVPRALGQSLELELRNNTVFSAASLLGLFQADRSNLSLDDFRLVSEFGRQFPALIEGMNLPPSDRARLQELFRRKAPGQRVLSDESIRIRLPLIGVIRDRTPDDRKNESWFDSIIGDADVYLPQFVAESELERLPRYQQEGYQRLSIRLVEGADLGQVADALKAKGLQVFSLQEFIAQLRTNTLLIIFGMNFLAIVAMLVSSLGIANIQIASVVERTREIGILKAVGASDHQVQSLFLLEGTILGFVGGLLGLLLGYLLSWPGEQIAQQMILESAPMMADLRFFQFPIGLIVGVPIAITLVTTLASFIPARRAARIDPIHALRYE
ncbi:ABC transporter permease [Tuwongella immobilis]|uniref:ABC3 transporter permease C-terminal domain-containing protein n=1 Tax=Tuwongella immobilis TaxID=692036 RepID=A0A6C2YRR6_9BACT|nr:ABC transporter permease [Tuwongella immobilis]VIP03675.1 macrolide abc transporter permease : ABC-type transport system, involved in lipoprotein release, permease component OS=Singulisphaera acidiphila (strain ATCC BAA-1392 / DSM 18658 / VKM B-2454 / MOB10) GN=Sinac_3397 PE=4 SV=1: MacB_PCD: FtsX [Tuwongella immobilis]VTS04718.1 macrolide abc transporter permease : ABC-type transport system, involved in lipoprotein release, permease component OS=Singulisphaera acidiphila (strain ATCC BAA-1392